MAAVKNARERTMNPLAPPTVFHSDAAQEWLELGYHLEVNGDLEKVNAELEGNKARRGRQRGAWNLERADL